MRAEVCGTPVSLALLCLFAVSSYSPHSGARESGTGWVHKVRIEGMAYEPARLTVKRGDTVIWVNKDPFPHSVTAVGVFDSGAIASRRSWRYKVRRTGSFSYTCTFHPSMKAALRVN